MVPDNVPAFPGPLAGILAGLDWGASITERVGSLAWLNGQTRHSCRWILSLVFMTREWLRAPRFARLCQGTGTHPVNALWSVSLRDDLRHALNVEGVRKVESWAACHGVAVAEWPTHPFDPFFNVNTPADLAEADALASIFERLALHRSGKFAVAGELDGVQVGPAKDRVRGKAARRRRIDADYGGGEPNPLQGALTASRRVATALSRLDGRAITATPHAGSPNHHGSHGLPAPRAPLGVSLGMVHHAGKIVIDIASVGSKLGFSDGLLM